jgi:hypothetical protein
MDISQCRSCGKDICWYRTSATGSFMPVDPVPVENGNVVIIDGFAHVIKGDLFEPMLPAGPRYKSHFATCSAAAQHRKPKEKS